MSPKKDSFLIPLTPLVITVLATATLIVSVVAVGRAAAKLGEAGPRYEDEEEQAADGDGDQAAKGDNAHELGRVEEGDGATVEVVYDVRAGEEELGLNHEAGGQHEEDME